MNFFLSWLSGVFFGLALGVLISTLYFYPVPEHEDINTSPHRAELISEIGVDNTEDMGYNNSWRHFLDALWQKESSQRMNPPDGDGGNAIGPYQIWRAYWTDAIEFDPSIGGTYNDCRDKEYAEQIVAAYMMRYANERRIGREVTVEDMARVHNGGPNGYKKTATDAYAESFLEIYDSLRVTECH